MTTNEYTFLLTDLVTGNIKDVPEISSFHWEEIYNRPGSGLATARYEADTTTPENFKDWSTALWAVKDNEIQWGGIIGKVQRRGATRVISIPVVGFYEYFRHRILRNTVGMTYGRLVRTSDIEWRDIDQFHIFRDMIQHAQHSSFAGGNIHVDVEWDNLSGELATLIYPTYATKFIGPALTTLSARLNGFDFRQVYRFENGLPRCNFKLTTPPHSTYSNHVLLFQPEVTSLQDITTMRAWRGTGDDDSFVTMGDVTHVTGDIQITVARNASWRPFFETCLRSKWGNDGDRGWRFHLLVDGRLRFQWTEDGTSIQTVDSVDPVSFANNTEGIVRATMDVDNGAGDYHVMLQESLDGINWTLLTTPLGDPYESTYGVIF